MKPIKLLALGAILVMTATSCDTYKHSYRLTDVPTSNIAVTNQVVDVKADFDNKVKASSDRINTSIADAKNNAYFNAIIENDIAKESELLKNLVDQVLAAITGLIGMDQAFVPA